MSNLLAKLKAEAKQLKEQSENKGNGDFVKINWFNPSVGDNLVRVLPNTKDADELFFKQVQLHYIKVEKKDGGMANVPVRCLSDFGEECPLCKTYKKLVVNEATKEEAREYRPLERYLYNVIDYKKREVFVYAAPMSVHQGLLEWVDELETNVADLETGHDFKVVKEVDPKRGKLYGTSYKVRPSLKATAVPAKLRALVESAMDLDTIYNEKRLDDMNKYLKISGHGTKTAPVDKPVVDEPVVDEPVFADDLPQTQAPTATVSEDDLERELRELGV